MTARVKESSEMPKKPHSLMRASGRACDPREIPRFRVRGIGGRGTGRDGSFLAYDPPRNEHEHHILRRSTVPAPLTAAAAGAVGIARGIAEALDYVGVLGVELFIGRNGEIAVNEIAPRVHNSGHWTIEACVVSQFEQHIRAVAGWPLGDARRHSDAVMQNIIGAEIEDWLALSRREAGLHIYGKRVVRPGRKMAISHGYLRAPLEPEPLPIGLTYLTCHGPT